MSQDAIPAATLIVIRERPGAPPELLMVERPQSMAFAGGAMVFPGGRIDRQDAEVAAGHPEPDAPARIAAIRETLEESGIAVGLDPQPSPALAAELQQELHGGGDFVGLLARNGLAFRLDALTPFAHWKPAFHQARIFDTMFFLAAAPPGDWPPVAQPGECESVEWLSAAAVLDRIARGDASAIFPTLRNLERLAQFAGFDKARADALAHRIDTISPWIADIDGEPQLCIPDGLGYPVTREPLASVRRGLGPGVPPPA